MRKDDTGASAGKVMGPHMQALSELIGPYDGDQFGAFVLTWNDVRETFRNQRVALDRSGKAVPEAFHDGSYIGTHGEHAFKTASAGIDDKNRLLVDATGALYEAQGRANTAKAAHAQLLATLPTAAEFMPNPDPSAPAYAQKGTGIDAHQAKANAKALAADQAAHAHQQAAFEHAEREAAHHNARVEEAYNTARPKVQALFHEPNPDQPPGTTPGTAGGTGPLASPAYARAGRSKVRAAQAVIDSTVRGSLGADAVIQEQKGIIAAAHSSPVSEWDATSGMWVNPDGSPADAVSFASVNVDGEPTSLSSLFSSPGGMVGAGFGAAAAALGISKMVKAGAGRAFGAPAASAAAKVSGAKVSGTSGRPATGAVKQNLNKAGSRSQSNTGKTTGSQTRTGANGRGGGKGKGKDKKSKGDVNYIANYTDDWIDNDRQNDDRPPPQRGQRNDDD